MKKKFKHTNVTVKLRESEYEKGWYLYIEAYPVYGNDGEKPKRVRESINRMVSTPVWDKSKPTRGGYKPKRDTNGVIICKSQKDQEACLYADKIRQIRQKEYDTSEL